MAGYQERPMGGGTNTVLADGWLLRLKANGDTLGGRYFGTPANVDYFTDVQPSTHGALLLCGGIRVPTAQQEQGWLLQLDSLGQVQWERRITSTPSPTVPNYELYGCLALTGGGALVRGVRFVPNRLDLLSDLYLAAFQPTGAGTAQTSWERLTAPATEPNEAWDLSSRGELTLSGHITDLTLPTNAYQPMAMLRLQLAERPYVPNLCQTPPQALFGYAPTSGGDSLHLVDFSAAGPRYAQLLRWRWSFGDGTFFDGPQPPPHRYPAGSGAGTRLTLTVTNNLGCTSTYVAFPLALATAAQRARQAQLSIYPNPAPAGTATVRLPGLRPQPAVPAELLNALGQVVRRAQWPATQLAQGAPLATEGLAAGIYTLRLRPQEGALVQRLVVQ